MEKRVSLFWVLMIVPWLMFAAWFIGGIMTIYETQAAMERHGVTINAPPEREGGGK